MILETQDLATLPDLNETIILEYLKARYKHDSIYTYIGDILYAIEVDLIIDIINYFIFFNPKIGNQSFQDSANLQRASKWIFQIS